MSPPILPSSSLHQTRSYATSVGDRHAANAATRTLHDRQQLATALLHITRRLAGPWARTTCPQCGCLLKDKIEPCPECYRNQHQLVVCDGCGCLCLPDETCPGCRARRMAQPMAQPNPQRRAA